MSGQAMAGSTLKKQDYETPQEFIEAVERRFGHLSLDLAAHDASVSRAPFYFTEAEDSLKREWGSQEGNLWLNPPFADIAPWVKKAADECRERAAWTFVLIPASIGAVYYRESILDKSLVLGLSPRMTFRGCTTPYPKDLMLCCYGFGVRGHDQWRWK